MPPRRSRKTGLSFVFALVINVLIIAALLGGAAGAVWQQHKQALQQQKQRLQQPVVQAVALNQQQVEQQIQAIKQARAAKKQAELDWKNRLQAAAKNAEAEQAEAQKNLSRLNAMQAKVQAKLDTLHSQRDALAKQNALVKNNLADTEKQLQSALSQAERAKLQAQLYEEKAKQRALEEKRFQNEISRYKALIESQIERQWLLPAKIKQGASCTLSIELDPYGRVKSVNVIKSSGDAILDRSATTAVLKASPLPVPSSPILLKQFRVITLTLKPEGVVGS